MKKLFSVCLIMLSLGLAFANQETDEVDSVLKIKRWGKNYSTELVIQNPKIDSIDLPPDDNENHYKINKSISSVLAGYDLLLGGDLEGAENQMRVAIDYYPQNSSAYAYLGTILYQQNKLESAIQAWELSLEINPDQDEVRSILDQLGGSK